MDFKEFLHVVSRMLTEDVTENYERMKEAFRMFDKVVFKYKLLLQNTLITTPQVI